MAQIAISLGSNLAPEFHLNQAIFLLRPFIDNLLISPVYESQPVNTSGENFVNCVCAGEINLSLPDTLFLLKSVEDQYGRDRKNSDKSQITLDLDLLFYDQQVIDTPVVLPRSEILTNAFVLQPLQDVCPDRLHPVLKKSYALIWKTYNNPAQQLWPIKFNWI
ncbi:2-amino-4-hydroxy-6-hydroxymethyldihydropteridine diphosphokinase [Gayadomonas joobiniege]|uniref:2-amino-4-hydroxy-6- hydroxymethyldihydropteridine diphosphokinase n=1 Tax=Gayadomonas joobiniege TaxID=1234606 RepID=UPI0003712304|nr:2-amino-4-hydroxy-6-hydroxymethyldihydropteridine diphosphokinase [Gayadomonas joobiniege]